MSTAFESCDKIEFLLILNFPPIPLDRIACCFSFLSNRRAFFVLGFEVKYLGWDGMGWDGKGWDGMEWDDNQKNEQVLSFLNRANNFCSVPCW